MENTDNEREDSRRIEKLILGVYSVYTLAMIIISGLLNWGKWVVPLIFIGMVSGWFCYARRYKSYRFRAFYVSAVAITNFLIYGVYAKDFFTILSTMGALVILLGIYKIPEIQYLAAGGSAFLLFYHIFIVQTIQKPENVQEGSRMLLQMISIFTIEGVTYYLIRTQLETQKRLMETIDDLKEAERSKDDFMANISHEIRTPINTISGMSEMLLLETLPENIRYDVQDIQMAGRNLLMVVSDILDFSELQSGKTELILEPYNLTSTIHDVMNMTIALRDQKDIELIVDCDARIPCSMLGDEQKIRRIIMNLVNNAVKFTKEGCITIAISARHEEYGANLSVKIKDTGIGIRQENLERLFCSFNQVDTQKNRQEGGIGLGLAIAKAMIQKMGGFITINSVYGKGTEAAFVIPQKVLDPTPIVSVKNPDKVRVISYFNMEKYTLNVMREDYSRTIRHIVEALGITHQNCRNLSELKRRIEKEIYSHVFISWEEYQEDTAYFERLSENQSVILVLDRNNDKMAGARMQRIYKPFYVLSIAAVLNGESVIQSTDGAHYQNRHFFAPQAKILVVDDNIMNLRVVEGLLRPYKIRVFTAGSGREALEKVNSMEYDFIFMDHMMPEMDGVEVLHRIRQKPGRYFQNVPIIALTANAIGGAREMFLAEGFQDFVAKPIELSVLERVLRRYIPQDKIIREEVYEQQMSEKRADTARACEPEPAAPDTTAWQERTGKFGLHQLQLAGINLVRGIDYCGGREEDYVDIAKIYYATGVEKRPEIQKFYEQGDWKNYTILVHALKSTSLGIGAVHLSELAKALEDAGKAQQEDFIAEHHEEMMQEYAKILAAMEAEERICAGEQTQNGNAQEQGRPLPVLTWQECEAYLNALSQELDNFEKEAAIALLHKLWGYQYKKVPLKDWTTKISQSLDAFDFMGAADELAILKDKMR